MNFITRRRQQPGSETGISQFRTEIDRLFDRFLDPWNGVGEMQPLPASFTPPLDITEQEGEYVVCAELPGMKPEDIDIHMSGNVLEIAGERKDKMEENRGGVYRSERRFGAFRRAIELPGGVDPDQIRADFDNGELVVHIPKSEELRPRQIPVNAAGRSAGGTNQPKAGSGQSAGPGRQARSA